MIVSWVSLIAPFVFTSKGRAPYPPAPLAILCAKPVEKAWLLVQLAEDPSVPHPCKYSQFGCDVKKPLKEIFEHEAKCPERTIKCPYLRCKEVIQIKKYHEHAMNSECSRSHSNNRQTNFSYIGKSASRVDLFWSVKPYEDHGKTFYLHHYFFPVSELLPFTSL